ncbi:hypothetical protein CCACVL1_02810 [Corchorus capsularis]|uniref:Uncharacterized protein n=1 Tax=Corchorus capsularis TaxID=210143 RepID=A0A1R3K5N8_COCAP|nr:hypothetical protein CCACVL1_02810 [Corchorus capsularis]
MERKLCGLSYRRRYKTALMRPRKA